MKLVPGMRLVVLAAAAMLPVPALANPNGRTDGATDCAPCHGGEPTGTVGVSISGSSTLAPGETGTYTLTIDQALDGGAFNVAITGGAGTLGSSESNVRIGGGELTHTDAESSPPGGNLGQWVYSFTVMAPGTIGETITLAAVGMQYVFDQDPSDDVWNSAVPFGINVVPEPGTAALFGLGLLGLALRSRGRRR